jgi:hypothetical protein
VSDIPEFGKPWAAAGETRPSRFVTVLMWLDSLRPGKGVRDDVLLVQLGTSPGDRVWWLESEWEAWVAEHKAAPVVPDADDDPLAVIGQP